VYAARGFCFSCDVYRAPETRLDRQVAIKVLPAGGGDYDCGSNVTGSDDLATAAM
jgi:hypothetical protein